jgi:hypothetical protein
MRFAFNARQGGEYLERRRGQVDCLCSRLAVRQPDIAAVEIDPFPA